MKILIYAHHFPPAKGGMEFSNFEICKGLHNLGHTIEVIACRNPGIDSFTSDLGFPVYPLPKWPFFKTYSLADGARANWIFHPFYRFTCRNRIREFKPDAVLVLDETANCFWGTWANKIPVPYIAYCSVPFVTVNGRPGRFGILSKIKFIGNEVIRNQFKRYLLRSYAYSKRVITVSQSTRSELLKAEPELDKKIDIIPRSINDYFFEMPFRKKKDKELRNELGIGSGDFVILSVSNLIAEKGIDDVLKAISGLDRPVLAKVKYLVVGNGSALDYLKKLTNELHIENIVIYASEIAHEQLVSYYDLCDLFILPSRRGKEESFCRVFAEAGARSKPSIGVTEGGMVDVVDDGHTGFLVPRGDSSMIRDRIIYFVSNPQQRVTFGQRAKKKAERKYRSEVVAIEFEKCLRAIIGSHT